MLEAVEKRIEALWNDSVMDKINDAMEECARLSAMEVRDSLQRDIAKNAGELIRGQNTAREIRQILADVQGRFDYNMKRVEDMLRSHEWLLKTGHEIKDSLTEVPGTLAEQGVEINNLRNEIRDLRAGRPAAPGRAERPAAQFQQLQDEIKRLREENNEIRQQFADDLEAAQDDAAVERAELRAVLRGLFDKLGYQQVRAPEPPPVGPPASPQPGPAARKDPSLDVDMDMD